MDGPSSKPRPSTGVTSTTQEKEDVVIVGQAFRLPGDINTPESFWTALMEKRQDIIVPVPASRWDHASFYRAPDSKEPPAPCDVTLEKAGFIDIEKFDHSFFGMTSAEAFHVPPSYRLSMEVAFEALENANIPAAKIKGSKMGVFVAAAMDEGYIKLLFADKGWAGLVSYVLLLCQPLISYIHSLYQILGNWRCCKHHLWTSELVSNFRQYTITLSNPYVVQPARYTRSFHDHRHSLQLGSHCL
jgi:acyl transferase domain-containing protein